MRVIKSHSLMSESKPMNSEGARPLLLERTGLERMTSGPQVMEDLLPIYKCVYSDY